MTQLRFALCDPEASPASELLGEMTLELNEMYERFDRLDKPALVPAELRPPSGAYLVGWEGDLAVAGGGVRSLVAELAEIKRMYVRPAGRSRGVAASLLVALESTASDLGYRRVRLDTGPLQVHAQRLYRRSGYVEIAPYNDNPFASYWGEKILSVTSQPLDSPDVG